MRSWRSFLIMAGFALVPLSVAATDKATDFLWEGSQLHFTPAALTAEELATATAQTSARASSGQNRISVGPRDTLWSIARTHRPARNITIKQAMLAIRDANPAAFPTGNINEMEAGSSLIIPSATAMRSRTASQAEEAVRRQNQAWVAGRTSRAPVQEERPEPQSQPDQPESTAPPEEAERDLQLSTAGETNEQQALIGELETRLEQSEDSLHRVEREKDELATRLSEMQEQLDTLQQLLRLKDEQLDELETRLADRSAAQSQPQAASSPAANLQPETAQPEDLLSLLQRQPLILGALGGLLLLLFILLLALVATRRKLAQQVKEQAEADEYRRREEELHSMVDSNAQPDDFNRDLNAQPLDGLDDLDLEDDLDLDDDFSEDLEDMPEPPPPTPARESKKERDPLQEAEMFIAYGRLEQAAGFLHKALANSPEREDLRIKLLEVLVELNDEDTFLVQKQQLEAQNPSAENRQRAEELSKLLQKSASAAAGAATAGAAAAVAANEEAEAEDLGEMELPDEDLDDLDLDDIFGPSEGSEEQAAESEEDSLQGLDELEDLDDLEAELDEVLTEKPPLEPSQEEDLDDDLSDLEELADDEAEDLDLELDLEKPLADEELSEDESDLQDFEPMDYKSDADDFMSALDEINLDTSDDSPHEEKEGQEQVRAPGVDEELSTLTDELSELGQDEESQQPDDEDWGDLDDLSDLDSLELDGLDDPQEPQVSDEIPSDDDLSSLDDLADLGDDLDFSDNDGDMNTQLDLATAYIEMGDKDGAQEILEKVVAEGDADQQATAKQMLESLSS